MDQVICVIAIYVMMHNIMYTYLAKRILVNQLEYAALLLQNSDLDINATAYRYNVYIVYHMTCIRIKYAGFLMLKLMAQSTQ